MQGTSLFSDRSIWTMIHGVGLGSAALLGFAAALWQIYVLRAEDAPAAAVTRQARALAGVTVFIVVMLWLSVLVGTYVIFPQYRATPPDGVTNLAVYPRALILADASNAWLHSIAMEIKEHVPWIAAMLATAASVVCIRHGSQVLCNASLRRITGALLAISFLLVTVVAMLGTLINKFAPLQ